MRIFVEHGFGRLKGRFQWLKCIPDHDLDEIYKTVEALFILHNFLESRNDDPTTVAGFHGLIVDVDLGVLLPRAAHLDLGIDDLFRAGLQRRKLLLELRNRIDA